MPKHGRYFCITYLLYCWYTYQDHKPAGGIAATEVQFFLIAGNMNWSFSNKSFSTYARRHIQGRSINYPITRQHGAQIRSLFFWKDAKDSYPNRLPVQACSSSSAASASSSLPIGWKSTVVQSIPIKAWKTASSWIREDGSISGA